MFCIRFSLCLILLGLPTHPVVAESPESSYKKGLRAEAKNNYDTAFEAFKLAHEKKPSDPKYTAAFLRIRSVASAKHVEAGEELRDFSKLQEALAEFRLAVQIDSSNFAAAQDLRRTADQIQKQTVHDERPARLKAESEAIQKAADSAGGPVVLAYNPDTPVSLHLATTADVIYKTIGKIAGLNVLIDPDYKPQKLNFELKDVSVREALAMIAMQSKTFWRAVSPNTIMVSSDNSGKRKELETNVMMTFYLQNAATAAELQQAATTLKTILDITKIQTTPELRSLTLRGTPDQMVLAQKLLADIDKPRAEVLIEVAVLEISRDKLRTLGINPPTSVSATLVPNASSSTGGSTGSGFTLNSLAAITANNIQLSIPGASLSFLMSDSNTKVIQKPQVRAMDSEKASLKIGDRIPIATGSYQSGVSNGVNTQFQYVDVGVNIDITPYVHGNNEVTLKMALEISSVTGEQTIDGVTEPTIGQRRIEHQARLADGEVNLIGGILEDTESKSLSGYPWLTKIPILKYLFGQENKERQQTEIVFAITPHIIRAPDVTDDNLRMVDIGTANSVTLRPADLKSDPSKPTTGKPPAEPHLPTPATTPSSSHSLQQ
jgi:general secretion pathway protein D